METPKQTHNLLPAFVSAKLIHAAKIVAVEPPLLLILEDGYHANIDAFWLDRRLNGQPAENAIGGYFVAYPDGYTSWAPAAAFEDSCIPFEQWGLSEDQEPKYTVDLKGKLVNRESGKPVDDPIFILRAQNVAARRAVGHFQSELEADADPESKTIVATIDSVGKRLGAFELWAAEHPERMKEPD